MKILLADDVEDNRFLIRAFLNGEPHTIVEACDGDEAFTLYQEGKGDFDLLLIDLHMPRCDGSEAIKKIRDFEKKMNLPERPSVAITAETKNERWNVLLEAGFSDFLQKPVSRDAVKNIIQKYQSRS